MVEAGLAIWMIANLFWTTLLLVFWIGRPEQEDDGYSDGY